MENTAALLMVLLAALYTLRAFRRETAPAAQRTGGCSDCRRCPLAHGGCGPARSQSSKPWKNRD